MNIERNSLLVLIAMILIGILGVTYFTIDFFTPTDQKCHNMIGSNHDFMDNMWTQVALDKGWCMMNDTGLSVNPNWSWFNNV